MMEGKTLIRSAFCSYITWILSSIWRKKSAMLLILGVLLILAFCIQYNVTKDILEIRIHQDNLKQHQSEVVGAVAEVEVLPKKRSDSSNVQFVGNAESLTSQSMLEILGKKRPIDKLPNGANNEAIRDSINEIYPQKPINPPYIPVHRIVHLDLKGAPPKPSYIKELFSVIKNLGATGVLLEWEDMFPWQDNLSSLAAGNAYTREEVLDIISSAENNKLEVIPLIQTFGHVEFALKNHEFSHLREVPTSPQALCPSLNSSMDFIQDMIDQVMRIHRDVNFLHIGCDEVFNMGECPRCRKKMRDDLFLSHVTAVASYIRRKYPYVNIIIWDDMLRHLPLSVMQAYHLGELVEPMVWVYAEELYRFVPQTVWEKYNILFPSAWTASAFKGAFGETYYIPNVKRHFQNNMNWLELMTMEDAKFKKGFRGIVITGWQRYDHFAVLCEILPAAFPSLTVNLIALSHGYYNQSLQDALYKGLNCPAPMVVANYDRPIFNFENDPFLFDHFSRCVFKGSTFFRLLHRLHLIEREIKEFLQSTTKTKGWLTDYNIRKNFTSPLRIDELMNDESRLYHSLVSLISSTQSALEDVFDKYTISEWIEQNIYPLVFELENLEKAANMLKMRKTWPRRPLPPLKDLYRLGLTFPETDNNLTTSG